MKRPLALCLFAVSVAAALIFNAKFPQSTVVGSSAYTKQPVVTDLGIPSASSYDTNKLNARNPWDMTVYDGKLYIGGGDFSLNTGPADIWCCDLESGEWSVSGRVNDEAVAKFLNIRERLVIPGIDPTDNWDFGNYYLLDAGLWTTVRNVPDGVHMFDIAEFSGGTFYAIGTSTGSQSPVKVTFDGETFKDVQFYIDGEPIVGTDGYGFSRAYDFFMLDNSLYCLCLWKTDQSQHGLPAFFKYDGSAFRMVENTDLSCFGNATPCRQTMLNEKVTFGNKCWLAVGTLLTTSDFVTFSVVEPPDGGTVQDLSVHDGKLYVLTSCENDTGFINTVWECTSGGNFTKVFSFDFSLPAMSFTKYEDVFFVGIGQLEAETDDKETTETASPLNGTILKIELQ